jgi:hypothetical protein
VEEFSKFTDSIYSHNEHDVFVNLFIASEVHWPEKGLTVRQKTSFPGQEGTSIMVKAEKPVQAGVNIRIPIWAVDGGTVELNGKALPVFSSAGSYLRITREWADGDRLEVKLPMRLRTEPLLGDRTQVAALYGPIVLAARLGTEGLTEAMQYDPDHGPTQLAPPHADAKGSANIFAKSAEEIRTAAWIEPVKGQPLTFQTVGQKNATMLIPLNQIFGERYAVYWKTSTHSEDADG